MQKLIYLTLGVLLLLAGCKKQPKVAEDNGQEVPMTASVQVIHLMDRPAPTDTFQVYSTESYLQELVWQDNHYNSHAAIVCHSPLPDSVRYSEHPFFDGVRYAYANHHPMVINPDVVWLTIEQGFALHVEHNAEALRYLFVEHEGQKELRVYCEPGLIDMPYNCWEASFEQFSDSLAAWTKDSIAQTLIADFSTTNPAALVASQIGLMSAMQHYFSYAIEASCGIPDIYLEGTAADWRHLIEKTERLRRYNLDWWIDDLTPVLTKIAESAEGQPDTDFWRSMYRGVRTDTLSIVEIAKYFGMDLSTMTEEEIEEMREDYYLGGCGRGRSTQDISGWITVFYPYTVYGDSPEDARIDRAHFDENTILDVPFSRTIAPLKYVPLGEPEMQLTLHAGLFTFTEDSITRAIRPTIAWLISKKE